MTAVNEGLVGVEKDLYQYLLQESGTHDLATKEYISILDGAEDLRQQALDLGFAEEHCNKLAEYRLRNYVENLGADKIPYGKIIPFSKIFKSFPDWFTMEKEAQLDLLWELGLNVKRHKVFIEAGCFSVSSGVECGLYLYGSERTDKAWLTEVVHGVNVASIEVRMLGY